MGTTGPRRDLLHAVTHSFLVRRYRFAVVQESGLSVLGANRPFGGGLGSAESEEGSGSPDARHQQADSPGLGDRGRDGGAGRRLRRSGGDAAPRARAPRRRRSARRRRPGRPRRPRRRAPGRPHRPGGAAQRGRRRRRGPRPHPHDGPHAVGRPLAEDRHRARGPPRPDPRARPCDDLAVVETQPRVPGLVAVPPAAACRSPGSRCSPPTGPARRRPCAARHAARRRRRLPPRRSRPGSGPPAACGSTARCRRRRAARRCWPPTAGSRASRRSSRTAAPRAAPRCRGRLIEARMDELRSGGRAVYVGWSRHYRCAPVAPRLRRRRVSGLPPGRRRAQRERARLAAARDGGTRLMRPTVPLALLPRVLLVAPAAVVFATRDGRSARRRGRAGRRGAGRTARRRTSRWPRAGPGSRPRGPGSWPRSATATRSRSRRPTRSRGGAAPGL